MKNIKLYKNDLLKAFKDVAINDGFNSIKHLIFTLDKRCISVYIDGFINEKKETKVLFYGRSEALFYLRFLKKITFLKFDNIHIYTDFKTINITYVLFEKETLKIKHLKF